MSKAIDEGNKIVFTLESVTPIDFSSDEIKLELDIVKKEVQSVLDGQIIDTSKLHIKFT